MEAVRNEVKIDLAGETRTMKASFPALMDIERDLRKSLITLINQAADTGDVSVTEAVTIIHHGLRGNKDTRLTFAEVGDAVMEVGLAEVLAPVVNFLGVALRGASVGKSKEPETAK